MGIASRRRRSTSTSAMWVAGPTSVIVSPSSTSTSPPSMATVTRSPTRPHVWAAWAAAQAPVPQASVWPAPRSHTRSSRRSAPVGGAIHSTLMPPSTPLSMTGPSASTSTGARSSTRSTRWGLPMSTVTDARRRRARAGPRSGPGQGLAHVDRATRRPDRRWPRPETVRSPASVAIRRSPGPWARAHAWARQRMPLPLISAREPSRVEEHHREVGVVRPAGGAQQQAVGADAGAAVAQRARPGRASAAWSSRTRKSLPRPWCLERRRVVMAFRPFSQPVRPTLRNWRSGPREARPSAPISVWRAGRATIGSSPAPTQVMRGSPRNQTRWRRAKRRVRRTARSIASSSRALPGQVGEQLLVAEGLAGGAAEARRRRGRAPRRRSRPRPGRRSDGRCARPPPAAAATRRAARTGSAGGHRGRGRTTRTGGRSPG